jgi:hypothetical protein
MLWGNVNGDVEDSAPLIDIIDVLYLIDLIVDDKLSCLFR